MMLSGRAVAGVPASVGFATKPELAAEMITAALDAGRRRFRGR
jgi:SRSO17 transposase